MTLQTQQTDLGKYPAAMVDHVYIQRELGMRTLHDFTRLAWPVLEPGREFIDNWHIGAICEHLEAVTAGEITRLLINVSPRCMKSLLCSVMWPVWVWLNDPKHRWLTASYAQDLATRDSVKARRLIQSNWFQERWGDIFQLIGDQNAKTRYENDHTGYRLATAVDALATGEGGDTQVIDDPHNVRQAESEVVRTNAVKWLNETMTTRFTDLRMPRRVMIMQRVHSLDCSGDALEQGGYVHLCLPMRFEKSRMYMLLPDKTFNPDYVPPTPLGFEDPRTEDGELMCPDRFPEGHEANRALGILGEGLAHLEAQMGPYAVAGQFQQRPTPRGGGMVKRDKLTIINPEEVPTNLRKIRSWDYAATDPEKQVDYSNPDWTVGVLMGATPDSDPDIYILDVIRIREDPGERDEIFDATLVLDGVETSAWIEQEPGASGKSVIYDARKRNPGYAINPPRPDPMPASPDQRGKKSKEGGVPSGNKVQRAEPFATCAFRGKVYILRAEWTPAYVAEITTFPLSAKKDQMDSTSQGYMRLMERPLSVAEAMAQMNSYGKVG